MKKLLAGVALLTLVGCTQDTAQIVDNVKDGTVLIVNDMSQSSNKTGGVGSGFIVEDNMIITNMHVIQGDGKIYVFSPESNKKYEAEVAFSDPVADIAGVRIKDWDTFKEETNPINLTLGDSGMMRTGDKVVVVGHPWGLSWSVSEGIISAKNRRPDASPKYVDQVDAHLYQGNSGGPIFNEKGEVVCVSNLMLSGEGGSYGFCVPSNLAKKIIYDYKFFGEVRWRALNITLGLTEDGSSVIINSIEPNGAADKAGLKVNDKLLGVHTTKSPEGVTIKKADDILTAFAELHGDDTKVQLLIERDGEQMMIDVETGYRLSSDFNVALSPQK